MTDESSAALWQTEQSERLRRGLTLFSYIAIVIFLLFSALDWVVFPQHGWSFLLLRLLCAGGYLALLPLIPRLKPTWQQTALGAVLVWWVSFIICVMAVMTGYERSLYYVGLIVTMLAMGLVFPWSWVNSLVVGLGMALMFVGVALLNPDTDARAAVNNTAFILGGLGIALAANVRDMRMARADFEARRKLTAANEQLRELDRMKSQFFANVSHELRTPLTLILSPLESLLADESLELPTSVRTHLTAMQRSAARLLRLINNLLDLSKIEAGQAFLRHESLHMSEFLESMLISFKALAERNGLELSFRPSDTEPVVVDQEKMEIVFENLLANALKFTPEGGTIEVAVHDTAKHVVVAVHDDGIGIPPDEVNRMFDRFAQADGTATRRFGGTGIGLALVKELVELHEGRVEVESEEGTGSTFRVFLPKGTAHVRGEMRDRRQADIPVTRERRDSARDPMASFVPRHSPPIEEQAGELSAERGSKDDQRSAAAARVLVVEDNPDLRSFLGQTLGRDYHTLLAADGDEALRLARSERPDLVLSDVMMPGRSGYELTEALKEDPRTREIPVILLTAKRGVDPTIEGFGHGADDYIGKPFSTRELMARVQVQLRLREMARQLAQGQKTDMLATLAAGLAHEIRNPVNAIVNSIAPLRKEIARGRGQNDGRIEELLELIDNGAERIGTMVQDLLYFTHLDRAEIADWDPAAGADSAVKLLQPRLGSVRVVRSYEHTGSVEARVGPVNQAVLNIVDNALRAVGDGGTIRITSRDSEGGVTMSIADDGPGIPAEARSRIFDPFFTTREVGEGVGLGLHLCRQVVEGHGGALTVESSPGAGTTFHIWLPRRMRPELQDAWVLSA